MDIDTIFRIIVGFVWNSGIIVDGFLLVVILAESYQIKKQNNRLIDN